LHGILDCTNLRSNFRLEADRVVLIRDRLVGVTAIVPGNSAEMEYQRKLFPGQVPRGDPPRAGRDPLIRRFLAKPLPPDHLIGAEQN
jgi:hypothetical protein